MSSAAIVITRNGAESSNIIIHIQKDKKGQVHRKVLVAALEKFFSARVG